MKYHLQSAFLVTALSLLSFNVQAQRGTTVGYIDMAYILESVEEYKKASQLLDSSIAKWKKEIELKELKSIWYKHLIDLVFFYMCMCVCVSVCVCVCV